MLLLFLALTSGHCRSSLRRVLPGDPLEAGPRGPGVRREGAASGKRTVGRERSHIGRGREAGATARAPRPGRGGRGRPRGALWVPPPPRAWPGWSQIRPWATCYPGASPVSSDRSCRHGGGEPATAHSGPLLGAGTGPEHQPLTRRLARHRPATGRGCLELARGMLEVSHISRSELSRRGVTNVKVLGIICRGRQGRVPTPCKVEILRLSRKPRWGSELKGG